MNEKALGSGMVGGDEEVGVASARADTHPARVSCGVRVEISSAEMVNAVGPGGLTRRGYSKFSIWLNAVGQELSLCSSKLRTPILK